MVAHALHGLPTGGASIQGHVAVGGAFLGQAHGAGVQVKAPLPEVCPCGHMGVTVEQNVPRPLPQGYGLHVDDSQTVIQVLPEAAFHGLLQQILVGGGDDAHVHRDHPASAHPADLFFLQDPQQPPLKSQGDLRDLVQKDGAVVGDLKQARLTAPGGAGEGALHIAEQLALQQVLRQGGAVDGYEVVL